MPKEVIITSWCDPCFAEDVKTESTYEEPVTLGSMKARTVLMCERHYKELVEPLRELLLAHGQIVEHTKRQSSSQSEAAGEFTCPDCGHVAPTRAALGSHGRSKHDKSLAEMLGEPAPYVCDTCGRKFGKPRALTMHMSRSHER